LNSNHLKILKKKITVLAKTEENIPLDVDNELLQGEEAAALEQEYVQQMKIQEKIQERKQLDSQQQATQSQEEILEDGVEEIIKAPKKHSPVVVQAVKVNSYDILTTIESHLTRAVLHPTKRESGLCLEICKGQQGMDTDGFCNKVCSGKTATF